MDRRTRIEQRLEEITNKWLQAKPQEKGPLLLERIRLKEELDHLNTKEGRSCSKPTVSS